MLIFSFFGKKSRVNNSTFFTLFLLKLVFFQKSHSPCRKKKIFEKTTKHNKKNRKKKMAKLLTLHGQDINSTAYIYIYVSVWMHVASNGSETLGGLAPS